MGETGSLNYLVESRLYAVLFTYLSLAFALMMTILHPKRRASPRDDYRHYLLYFASFFLIFFAVPCLLIFILARNPLQFLEGVGFTFGQAGRGIIFLAIGLPLAVLSGFIGSRDPKMRLFYPFSKRACARPPRFATYEAAYFFLYYLPWEFLYRGLLFFPVLAALGLWPALALQTIISTLYHFGHPDTEVIAALAAGFIFGFIAFLTGSFLYTVLIHATAGISTDVFIYRRNYRDVA